MMRPRRNPETGQRIEGPERSEAKDRELWWRRLDSNLSRFAGVRSLSEARERETRGQQRVKVAFYT
jgi:hypothetical protein